MHYDPSQMTWTTDKGNVLSPAEAHYSDLFRKAENLAWPRVIVTHSISDWDWGAQDVNFIEKIGERPKFGEKRTIEALEMLIDERVE